MNDLFSDEYLRRAWSLARTLVRTSQDAEEVLQDACLIAIKKASTITGPEQWPWFVGVVRNSARNFNRRRQVRVMEEITSEAPAQEALRLDPNDTQHLLDALNGLNWDEREAVVLCHMQGFTQEQASEILSVNVNTLKARVRRGLDRLRDRIRFGRPGLEAYLAGFAVPPPSGGYEAALARWRHGGASVPGAAMVKIAGLAAFFALSGLALWLSYLVVSGDRPTADQNASFVGANPTDGESSRASSPGGDLKTNHGVKSSGVSPEVITPPTSQTPSRSTPDKGAREEVVPPNALPGMLQVRTKFYGNNTIEAQWTELVRTPNWITAEGTYRHYLLNGVIDETGEYQDGKRMGTWEYRYENGELWNKGEFKDDREHGVWDWYDKQARLTVKCTFVRGLKEGPWTAYHSNGTVKETASFLADQKHGLSTCFDENGVKTSETQWQAGKKHGTEMIYTPTGPERHDYDHGKLVK